MSLVSTLVLADDGHYYANPVLSGQLRDGTLWFICFDDDDPPELVWTALHGHKPNRVLEEVGIQARIVKGSRTRCGQRCFNGRFHTAESVFLKMSKPIPVKYLGFGDKPVTNFKKYYQAVWYTFGRKPPRG